MSKKIIGFKLIKEYPGSPRLHTEVTDSIRFNDIPVFNGIDQIDLLNKYSEFWEPIYEQGVDLNEIHQRIAETVIDTGKQDNITIRSMKEACRQTLELVIKEFFKDDKIFEEQDIRNLINKIK